MNKKDFLCKVEKDWDELDFTIEIVKDSRHGMPKYIEEVIIKNGEKELTIDGEKLADQDYDNYFLYDVDFLASYNDEDKQDILYVLDAIIDIHNIDDINSLLFS